MLERLPELLMLRGLTRLSRALSESSAPSHELIASLDAGLRRAADVVDALAASVAAPRPSDHRPGEVLEELVVGWAQPRPGEVLLDIDESLHAPHLGDLEASELLTREVLRATHGRVVVRARLQAHRGSWALMRVEIEDDGPLPGDVIDEALRQRLAQRLGGAAGVEQRGPRRRVWWTEVLERAAVETIAPPPKGLRSRRALVRVADDALRLARAQQLSRWGMTAIALDPSLGATAGASEPRPDVLFSDRADDQLPGVPTIVVGGERLTLPYRVRELRALLFETLRRASHVEAVPATLREVGTGAFE